MGDQTKDSMPVDSETADTGETVPMAVEPILTEKDKRDGWIIRNGVKYLPNPQRW